MEQRDIDSRISRLEATVEGLASNVGSLAESVRSLASRDQTNWQSIFAGIAVLLTLGGAFLYVGVVRPQVALHALVTTMQEEEREHTRNGHPHTVQQEIKLRNEAQDKDIASLDRRMTNREINAHTEEEAAREYAHIWDKIQELNEGLNSIRNSK